MTYLCIYTRVYIDAFNAYIFLIWYTFIMYTGSKI